MYDYFRDELIEFLKEYNPIIEEERDPEYPNDFFAYITLSNKAGMKFKINYRYSEFHFLYDDGEEDIDWQEEWTFSYCDITFSYYNFESFSELRECLNQIFDNKICFLISEQNGKRIGTGMSDILYTKEMHMRKGRTALAQCIPTLREIKRFIKNHGTIKVIYWDPDKSFEYQVL